ncbi:MAG: SLBB domain-containing protein [Campylobacterota bacterium]|nr:SLBB domain-containing protein [Campylobacterota bacterium]
MRLIFSLFIIISCSLAVDVSLEDIQKYKNMLSQNNNIKYPSYDVDVQQPQNNIDEDNEDMLENKDDLLIDDFIKDKKNEEITNIFRYEYGKNILKRYGDNFFKNKNLQNALSTPTSDNYLLNNGDTIFINIFNANKNNTYELNIDNNSNINIPNIGLLKVGFLSFADAKKHIVKNIKRSLPSTDVIVDISKYSTIQVIVTGNVEVPGIYNLSSFSSIKDALLVANGVLEIGSYRDISVIRSGKKIHNFDLYKLLHDPINGSDILLRDSDIVSVNFSKKTIVLDGKVKYPAIYELKDNESFKDLMKYSGGFGFDATKKSIRVTRYDEEKNLKTFILDKNSFFSLKPQEGDKIEVFNNIELKEKEYIYVHGKVLNEGTKYTYYKGMTLKELFESVTFRSEIVEDTNDTTESISDEPNNNKIKREALFVDKKKIKVVRNNDDKKRSFIVSLDDKFILKAFDSVEFFNYFDTNINKTATVKGEVYKEGEIYIDDDMTINKFLALSGGLKKTAYDKEFELVRFELKNGKREFEIKKLNLKEALSSNFKIKDGDVITIFKIPSWDDGYEVTIKGEVKFPGRYTIKKGDKLYDLISRAGGYTKDAFLEGALFTRESIKENENRRLKESMYKIKRQLAFSSANGREAGVEDKSLNDLTGLIELLNKQVSEYEALGRLTVELNNDLDSFKVSNYNIRLEDRDTLIIPHINDTVAVYGEVTNPNSFIYNKELTSSDYLQKAGGVTQRADENSIYVVLANGEAKKLDGGYLFSYSQSVPKGSAIIVPMRVNEVSNLLLWKDISQVLYQLAITAASLETVGAL